MTILKSKSGYSFDTETGVRTNPDNTTVKLDKLTEKPIPVSSLEDFKQIDLPNPPKENPVDKPIFYDNQTEKQKEEPQTTIKTETSDVKKLMEDLGLNESMSKTVDEEAINKNNDLIEKKKKVTRLSQQMNKDYEEYLSQIEELDKNPQGMSNTALQSEKNKISNDFSRKQARDNISYDIVNDDYKSALETANKQIEREKNTIKNEIETKKFLLEQIGGEIATKKSQEFQIQLKALDKESDISKKAIESILNGIESGTVYSDSAMSAIQNYIEGKSSLSDLYSQSGMTGTDGSNIGGYDITSYATDPKHEQKVMSIYDSIIEIKDEKDAQSVIDDLNSKSPITGKMVYDSAKKYGVNPGVMISLMQQDSSLGTAGLGLKTKNPGNVGNDDAGNIRTYKTWNDGVDAVAEWLSKHKATKNKYNGEFGSTIETVTYATNEPDKTKKTNLKNLQTYIANEDYKTAYKQIENTVSKILTGENKTTYDAKRVAVPSVQELKDKLQAYSDNGGKTGLLKGTYEKIYNNLGEVKDPKYKSLATDLRIALQRYRKDMSGAAFSEQEAKDYESVNPSGKNSLDLNISIIDGMLSNFKTQIDSTVDTYAGDGAKYIREYAETGKTPKSKQTTPTYTTTPNGNSYTIISN